MADRKAVNKWIPPDFDPKRHRTVNKYHHSHPLRERARKLDEGILVIRFEMPFNSWCEGCGEMVAMGIRFNAEKSKAGKYYSTPIWRFRMKCRFCGHQFEMQTDPKNTDYQCIEGLRRKEEGRDLNNDDGALILYDKKELEAIRSDPFLMLETRALDEQKAAMEAPRIQDMVERSDELYKNDYMNIRAARKILRGQQKELEGRREEDKKKYNLSIDLLSAEDEDAFLAARVLKKRKTVLRNRRGKKGIFSNESHKTAPEYQRRQRALRLKRRLIRNQAAR